MKQPKAGISDEEIYELREQGMTYQEIANYFDKKGIKISLGTIRLKCKKIYGERGKEEPKAKKIIKKREDVTDEEIYELREQGMTYDAIASYFDKKGIKLNWNSIRQKCKRIYKQKGKKEPKVKRKKDITDVEIYELRKQGMSYQEISKYFEKDGKKISCVGIRERCKKIYEQKGKEEPKAKNKRKREDITDEEIYELREQGMTYDAIAIFYQEKNIKVSVSTIRERCKRIYKQKGKEEPKAKRKKEITDEEIYELREQGMTYEAIAKFYEEKNIKVSLSTIRERCKSIYKQKGKKETKVKRKGTKRRKEVTEEEIYKLREQGMTYEAIAQFYEEKGIKISWPTIRERCKRIYKQKGKEEPKAKRKKDITDEEIYELREQGMTYDAIAKFYEEKGTKISRQTIIERCREIYKQKGKKEPKAKRKKDIIKEITDEEIYKMREQGMSYEAIASYFEKKGIKIAWNTIKHRCKRIYMEKGKEEPKVKRKKEKKDIIDEEIYELREQGMTYGAIAQFYEEKGIKISWSTIRERCNGIYEQKGKEEPKLKTGRRKQHKIDNESLEALNEELNEKIKKKLEMEKILNTLRDYIERNTEGVEK